MERLALISLGGLHRPAVARARLILVPIDIQATSRDVTDPMKTSYISSWISLICPLRLAIYALTIAIVCQSSPVLAQARHYRNNDEVTTSSAGEYSVGSDHRWGLGLATMTGGMLVPGSNGALTGWIGITPEFGIQPILSVSSTSPFQFAGGALFKVTVHQMASSGFHVGGGITLGDVYTPTGVAGASDHSFMIGLAGLMGFHFVMPGTSNIMVHFDGGPMVNVTGGNATFALTPISAVGGLSVLYLF